MLPAKPSCGCAVLVVLTSALVAPTSPTLAQDFRLERIASGLNQPTFVTQAPGDDPNVLYYIERTVSPNATFGANSAMGKVSRYDVATRTATTVLDLSARSLTQDGGLLGIAFHPDFSASGSAGFGKFYTSTAQSGGPTAVNRVEEWSLPGGTGTATLSRTILQYNNAGTSNNHTVDWIGFNPAATGDARTFLHISTGDGSAGLTNKPSQNLADVKGKILRVDVAGADAYPADANKNFAIPASNPLVAGGLVNASRLGEVYASGLRNGWRASFDRANGDMYIGDVGEGTFEEVNFLKAGTNQSGLPVDFGWPQREGTGNGPPASAGPSPGSLNPIRQRSHAQGDFAVTGGYVYRGPIEQLQGRYIYGEFVGQRVYGLDFDRDTPTSAYDGAQGVFQDITGVLNTLCMDPADPNYTFAQAGQLFGIDRLVSFGEDNAGNLYVVDFGYGTDTFGGQYPPAGRGEIFRLTAIPEPATLLGAFALLSLLPRTRGRRLG
jgi:glucose/arabinose dehydrogenase